MCDTGTYCTHILPKMFSIFLIHLLNLVRNPQIFYATLNNRAQKSKWTKIWSIQIESTFILYRANRIADEGNLGVRYKNAEEDIG